MGFILKILKRLGLKIIEAADSETQISLQRQLLQRNFWHRFQEWEACSG